MNTNPGLLSGSPPTSPKGRADSPNRVVFQPYSVTDQAIMDHESPQVNLKQNHVATVVLRNVPIVSLYIDGQERLCLAQISNTLLRDFSYNEIHNRRVALGITCIQCTPVQLEILRRAGAMPVSSRRCGMITKREAERLVKSFLEDTIPPQLPENFCFDVRHDCGWGCRGNFIPARYNSSRAKCIKCIYCNNFFSPNKFIFHCHKIPSGTYRHPDAANFNSWRRHLKLSTKESSDDLEHAWEDVKAMFNGGSRKRLMSSPQAPITDINDNNDEIKRPRMDMPQFSRQQPYPYHMFATVGTNPYRFFGGMFPRASHPAFPFMAVEQATYNQERRNNQEIVSAKAAAIPSPYTFLWGKGQDVTGGENRKMYQNKLNEELFHERNLEVMRKRIWRPDFLPMGESPSPPASTSDQCIESTLYSSAFTPVKRDTEQQRKTRKNKPKKGLTIGAIADSILQRNMMKEQGYNDEEDTVEVEVSDDEVGRKSLLKNELEGTKMGDFGNITGHSRERDNMSDIGRCERPEAADNIPRLSPQDSCCVGRNERNDPSNRLDHQLSHSRQGPCIENNDIDISQVAEDIGGSTDENFTVGDTAEPKDISQFLDTSRTSDNDDSVEKYRELHLQEMSQLQFLRHKAEREYSAIEGVLANTDNDLTQMELKKKLSDAHDALRQFSDKILLLTSGLEKTK